jgi:hypothetical protein
MNSHRFEKKDPHRSKKPVSCPHQTQKPGALEALNGAMEAHPGAEEVQSEALGGFLPVVADSHHFDEDPYPDLHQSKSRIRIRIKVKSWIRIRTKVKSRIQISTKVRSRIRIRINVIE